MNSAAFEGWVLANLPWYCTAAAGSDGAALTSFVGSFERPHELKSDPDTGMNCRGGPASMSTHSDCVPRVMRMRRLLEITSKGLSAWMFHSHVRGVPEASLSYTRIVPGRRNTSVRKARVSAPL